MNDTDWNSFYQRWSRLKPPLRANAEVVAALRRIIEGRDEHALLLGVTPELSEIALRTTAVDKSQTMVDRIWPGDTDTRCAFLGNWLTMPLQRREFSAVIGDGSLNAVAYADYAALFAQLEKLLVPGARLAIRVYETPEPGQTITQVQQETMAGKIAGFHAFKWRLAMAMTAEAKKPDIPVAAIHAAFDRAFADREALSTATGWSIAEIGEIDAYATQDLTYSFPTRDQIAAVLPSYFTNPRFVTSGSYELAERCPILTADFMP